MSTRLMALCWPLVMSPTQKAVLISLADQANDQGFCWPSIATISERTCLSERAVRGAVRSLESLGHVVAHSRSGTSTYYQLTPAGNAPLKNSPTPAGGAAPAADAGGAGHAAPPAGGAGEGGSTCRGPRQEVPPNRKEPSMNRKEPSDSGVDTDAKAAIDYLNEKINSRFQATKQNCGHVRARIGEGNTLDDVKAVIDFKVQEWGKDAHMRQYLRPETLFGKKFPGYLVAARAATQTKRPGDLSGKNYREGVDEDGRPN